LPLAEVGGRSGRVVAGDGVRSATEYGGWETPGGAQWGKMIGDGGWWFELEKLF